MSVLNVTLVFKNDRLVIHTPDTVQPPLGALNGAFVSALLSPQQPPADDDLASIAPTLWATHKDEVGLVQCPPYEATIKHSDPVYIKQYPLSEDKMCGIDIILTSLLTQGVLKRCTSAYNTPVNPVHYWLWTRRKLFSPIL